MCPVCRRVITFLTYSRFFCLLVSIKLGISNLINIGSICQLHLYLYLNLSWSESKWSKNFTSIICKYLILCLFSEKNDGQVVRKLPEKISHWYHSTFNCLNYHKKIDSAFSAHILLLLNMQWYSITFVHFNYNSNTNSNAIKKIKWVDITSFVENWRLKNLPYSKSFGFVCKVT